CTRWAVVTTIFAPTAATKAVDQWWPKWCLLVIADKAGPDAAEYPLEHGIYVSVEVQQSLAKASPFIAALPWNHFGRKNVGYLIAALHGAEVVWDFDDDNVLNAAKAAGPLSWVLDSESGIVSAARKCRGPGAAFNPYPSMGATESPCWPRGFPLQDIKSEAASELACGHSAASIEVRPIKVAVLQALAGHDPDVDAIYRLTRPLPLYFNFEPEKILLVSRRTLSPYNAQATLHFKAGLFAMLLPVTV
ncbi:hypothetical protein JKP88DRAFT_130521, partial [Tribonema minus]